MSWNFYWRNELWRQKNKCDNIFTYLHVDRIFSQLKIISPEKSQLKVLIISNWLTIKTNFKEDYWQFHENLKIRTNWKNIFLPKNTNYIVQDRCDSMKLIELLLGTKNSYFNLCFNVQIITIKLKHFCFNIYQYSNIHRYMLIFEQILISFWHVF